MPTYEFRCPQGHEFEKFYRSIGGAEAQAACPVCEQPSERMMSATGFAFKGSGFYLTDYGKNAHREKGTPAGASAPSAEGAKGDGSRPESKPESKAESAPKSEASTKAAEPKKAAPVSDAKPAAAAPKKSTGE
jgi:putative FmdB family regulatory protein